MPARPPLPAPRALAAALLAAAGLGAARPRAAAAQPQSAVADSGAVRWDAVPNQARVAYRAPDGADAADSARADVRVARRAVLVLAARHAAVAAPGERRAFAHRVRNAGTDADRVALAAAAPHGWPAAVYLDRDGDGVLGAADAPLAGPVALAPGDSAALLVVVDVPASASGDAPAEVTLSAASAADPAVRPAVADRITVERARPQRTDTLPALTFAKAVDRARAAAGDTLTYTLAWANRAGAAPAAGAVLRDPLPAGVRYVPGSLRLGGRPLTDAADGDAGQADAGASGGVVRVALGTVAGGASGSAEFRAVALPGVVADVANVAELAYADPAAAPGDPALAVLRSPAAETRVAAPRLAVAKALLADSVRVGGEARYRLSYRNDAADATARDVVLADTLPAELQYVAADRAARVDGQVVTWALGDLAPGAEGAVTLVARVLRRPAGPGVVNTAALAAANGAAVTASAARLTVTAPRADALRLEKKAAALEAALGETVGYALTLRNAGERPLAGLVVTDLLPAGTRFAPGSVAGADSARASGDGRVVRFYVAGPLAAGAEAAVRYAAAVVAPGRQAVLENRAVASAEGGAGDGRVASDTARAWVRVRAGFALQGRTLLGKVFVDRDGDGRQGPGEEGVAGARVWTADGELVTTDRDGRYSLRDVRPGPVLLRLDTLGLPAGAGLARGDDGTAVATATGWTTPRVDFALRPRAARAGRGAGRAQLAGTPDVGGAVVGGALAAARERAAREAAAAEGPATEPLRTAGDRAGDAARELVDGPSVRITSPRDGRVVGGNRLYVGVKGEPGALVRLYDGARPLGEATLRPDGAWDFVGVELAPGPHRLRVWQLNSWHVAWWDSVAVHRSGDPAAIEVPRAALTRGAVTLRAGAPDTVEVRVRVLDRWGVPLATAPAVTVDAAGATVAGRDADRSSVGEQRAAGPDGALALALLGGRGVGPGQVRLSAGRARAQLPLRVLPFVRPLVAAGVGQVGLGAAPERFGALTVRGALGAETAVSVSYDTRRRQAGALFGRAVDPLDDVRYPTFGDGSERQTLSAGETRTLSARLERGFDWLQVGDVQGGFAAGGPVGAPLDGTLGSPLGAAAGGAGLVDYRRALTGASARVGTGAVTWQGFGSVTRQRLEVRQLRGDGGSGPYFVGGGVRGGTERVAVEVRAADNAARVIAREELTRFADYRIDYATGAVLLTRAVPAADPYGNPVYVVATVERAAGGAAAFVGGGRAELDAARALRAAGLRLPGVDSLAVGVSGVHDGGAADAAGAAAALAAGGAGRAAQQLVGADLRAQRGALAAGVGVVRARAGDSAAVATRLDARWAPPSAAADGRAGVTALTAAWSHVGRGFAGAADPRLAAAVDELRLGGAVRVAGDARVELAHEVQRFRDAGAERRATTLRATEQVRGRQVTQQLAVATDATTGTPMDATTGAPLGQALGAAGAAGSATLATAKLTAALTPRLDVWTEGTRRLAADGAGAAVARPDLVGVGASYRVLAHTQAELSHRWVRGTAGPPDSAGGAAAAGGYALTSLNLRQTKLFGGQGWAGYERASAGDPGDDTRAAHAAVLGWNERLALGGGWSLTSVVERRLGLTRAPLLDPARALPFARPEPNRSSLALGAEWLPGLRAGDARAGAPRFSALLERHAGAERAGGRALLAADAPLGTAAALLTRHDWSRYRLAAGAAGPRAHAEDARSLVGLALRPVRADRLNALAKLEWRRTRNPGGALGALAVAPDAAAAAPSARVIGAADAIYEAGARTELAARYAVRWAAGAGPAEADRAAPRAQFLGLSAEQGLGSLLGDRLRGSRLGGRLGGWAARPFGRPGAGPAGPDTARTRTLLGDKLRARLDARLLRESTSGARAWSVAPSLVARVTRDLDLDAGYRTGSLRDADFAATGGHGPFVTARLRLTESVLRGPAAYWRERVADRP